MSLSLTACSGGGYHTATVRTLPASTTTGAATTSTTSPPATTSPASVHPVPPTAAVTVPRSSVTAPPAPPLPSLGSPLSGGEPWQPAGNPTAAGYGIFTTQLSPAAGVPAAGVAWIDSGATRVVLYAGTMEPPGTWPDQGSVATDQQANLLAAFNSGFQIANYRTGWYEEGKTAMPLQAGAASFVINSDGTATVGQWGRDVSLGPAVQAVRQNLSLLVDKAQPVASATVASVWGDVLQGGSATWRSGIGVTVAGDLVYVGGLGLTPLSLARILVAAGALRAMELDINPGWVSFATFAHTGGTVPGAITKGANLLDSMLNPPSHYLAPFPRDFFAVFAR